MCVLGTGTTYNHHDGTPRAGELDITYRVQGTMYGCKMMDTIMGRDGGVLEKHILGATLCVGTCPTPYETERG